MARWFASACSPLLRKLRAFDGRVIFPTFECSFRPRQKKQSVKQFALCLAALFFPFEGFDP
jgi:hypothetical protein